MVRKSVKGSMTVEASVVLPILVYILLLIVYLSFYVYSRYALSLDAYISVFRGSRSNLLTENTYETVDNTMEDLTKEPLPGLGGIRYEIESGIWKNAIEVKSSIRIPFAQSVINRIYPVRINIYAERTEPALFLRNCRKIEKLLSAKQPAGQT